MSDKELENQLSLPFQLPTLCWSLNRQFWKWSYIFFNFSSIHKYYGVTVRHSEHKHTYKPLSHSRLVINSLEIFPENRLNENKVFFNTSTKQNWSWGWKNQSSTHEFRIEKRTKKCPSYEAAVYQQTRWLLLDVFNSRNVWHS